MDEFTGIIRPFAGNYAPYGWAVCDGSLLQIRQYTALFAILGNQFGGDGRTTFGLPDLRGLMVVGSGTIYDNAEKGGVAKNAISSVNMPSHSHAVNSTLTMMCNTDGSDSGNPIGQYYGVAEAGSAYAGINPTATTPTMAPLVSSTDYTVASTGTSAPYDNRMPYVAMTYIICLDGTYPVRN